MAENNQARAERRAPETEISVDLSESDGKKAVTRRTKVPDIAENVRDDQEGASRQYSPTERNMFRRLSRHQRNITKQFDQKLADQEARHQREMTELRTQYEGVSVERGGDTAAASEHERAMKALEDKLAAANEKGDSAEAARITAEMIKADGAYHAKLSGAKQRDDTAGAAAARTVPVVKPASTGPTPAGSRFILANEDWWEDPDFALEKQYASTIYLKLMNDEGYEANSDETFEEVARRLKEKFRDLPVVAGRRRKADPDDLEGGEYGDDAEGQDRNSGENRRRAPTAAMQDRGQTTQRRQRGGNSLRSLTGKEIETMRKVGLNPDNDKDVMQFVREAAAMEESA